MKCNKRTVEACLLLVSSTIIVVAYVLASIGRYSSLPANIVPFFVIVVLLFAAAHIAMKRFAPHANPILLPVAGTLNGIGYVFIARLQDELAGLQALWTLISVLAFMIILAKGSPVRQYQRYKYSFLFLGFVLLLLPLFPLVGKEINGARTVSYTHLTLPTKA